jgi:hypothetical protein
LYRGYQISGTCTYDTNKCNRPDCTGVIKYQVLVLMIQTNVTEQIVQELSNIRYLKYKYLIFDNSCTLCSITFICVISTSTWYLITPVQNKCNRADCTGVIKYQVLVLMIQINVTEQIVQKLSNIRYLYLPVRYKQM